MHFDRTRGGDWLAALGGLALLVALFLPWYDVRGVGVSGWESLAVTDLLLALFALLAIAMPLVTAARDTAAVPLVVTVLAQTVGVFAVIAMVVRVIWPAVGTREWGLWVALVATLFAFYAVYLAMRDDRAPGLRPAPEPVRMPAPGA